MVLPGPEAAARAAAAAPAKKRNEAEAAIADAVSKALHILGSLKQIISLIAGWSAAGSPPCIFVHFAYCKLCIVACISVKEAALTDHDAALHVAAAGYRARVLLRSTLPRPHHLTPYVLYLMLRHLHGRRQCCGAPDCNAAEAVCAAAAHAVQEHHRLPGDAVFSQKFPPGSCCAG